MVDELTISLQIQYQNTIKIDRQKLFSLHRLSIHSDRAQATVYFLEYGKSSPTKQDKHIFLKFLLLSINVLFSVSKKVI